MPQSTLILTASLPAPTPSTTRISCVPAADGQRMTCGASSRPQERQSAAAASSSISAWRLSRWCDSIGNRDLAAEIAKGRFREDLFYRLNVVTIRLPPLRDRPEDVPALLDHYLRHFACEAGRQPLRLSSGARALLGRYAWPGNVRELANVVERAVVLAAGDVIDVEDLPEEIVESRAGEAGEAPAYAAASYHQAVIEAKRAIIRDALRQTDGHQTRAAELLGMGQPYLARLMKNLGIARD